MRVYLFIFSFLLINLCSCSAKIADQVNKNDEQRIFSSCGLLLTTTMTVLFVKEYFHPMKKINMDEDGTDYDSDSEHESDSEYETEMETEGEEPEEEEYSEEDIGHEVEI